MSDSAPTVSEAVDILVDVSTSMGWEPDGKEPTSDKEPTRFDLVRSALSLGVIPDLRDDLAFGLKYFGGDCKLSTKVRTIVNIGQGHATQIRERLADIEKPSGSTPLAAALRLSLSDLLRFGDIPKRMLIFTDGEETCEPKAALDAVISELEAHNFKFSRAPLVIHAVTVGVVTPAVTETLKRVVSATPGGTLEEVPSAEDAAAFSRRLVEVTPAAIRSSPLKQSVPADKTNQTRPSDTVPELQRLNIERYWKASMAIQILILCVLGYMAVSMPNRGDLGEALREMKRQSEMYSPDALRSLNDKVDIQAEALQSLARAIRSLREPSNEPTKRAR